MITEKERNVETNKLMHHTLTAIDNLKLRLNGLVNNFQTEFHCFSSLFFFVTFCRRIVNMSLV